MSFSKEKKVEKSLKSFEDQQLDAEALKSLVGGNGGENDPPEDDPEVPNVVSDDIIMP